MIETPMEKLQRAIFSVDTEAGYRFRYHVTRAQVQEGYINSALGGASWAEIKKDDDPAVMLLGCFSFKRTKEGHRYWYDVVYLLEESSVS